MREGKKPYLMAGALLLVFAGVCYEFKDIDEAFKSNGLETASSSASQPQVKREPFLVIRKDTVGAHRIFD